MEITTLNELLTKAQITDKQLSIFIKMLDRSSLIFLLDKILNEFGIPRIQVKEIIRREILNNPALIEKLNLSEDKIMVQYELNRSSHVS